MPLLTAAALRSGAVRSGSLVRFVGMVQDQLEPDLYEAVALGGACARAARGVGVGWGWGVGVGGVGVAGALRTAQLRCKSRSGG